MHSRTHLPNVSPVSNSQPAIGGRQEAGTSQKGYLGILRTFFLHSTHHHHHSLGPELLQPTWNFQLFFPQCQNHFGEKNLHSALTNKPFQHDTHLISVSLLSRGEFFFFLSEEVSKLGSTEEIFAGMKGPLPSQQPTQGQPSHGKQINRFSERKHKMYCFPGLIMRG